MDPNTQPSETNGPTLDMDAINAAVDASANEAVAAQGAYNVNDITLENTPTSDAQLANQQSDSPEISPAGTPVNADAPAVAEPVAPAASTEPAVPEAQATPVTPVVDPAPVAESAPVAPESPAPSNEPVAPPEASTETAPVTAPSSANFDEPSTEAKSEETDEEVKEGETEPKAISSDATEKKSTGEKVAESAQKAIGAIKPKNNAGVIIASVIGVVLLFAIVIAVAFATGVIQ